MAKLLADTIALRRGVFWGVQLGSADRGEKPTQAMLSAGMADQRQDVSLTQCRQCCRATDQLHGARQEFNLHGLTIGAWQIKQGHHHMTGPQRPNNFQGAAVRMTNNIHGVGQGAKMLKHLSLKG